MASSKDKKTGKDSADPLTESEKKLHTEMPLSEKDEVKQAEQKVTETSKKK
ncbi:MULTISPECIES: hypothetical protein [unclassified Mucilaginibacter]|uniref:hypothetical protein n=1 Tax=unclassified Mucilaginibacter TaxID=2617802 RepID=UPI000B059761|nr:MULTISPECIES: hypothetical protein [unclassified Mucilaginibacter]